MKQWEIPDVVFSVLRDGNPLVLMIDSHISPVFSFSEFVLVFSNNLKLHSS